MFRSCRAAIKCKSCLTQGAKEIRRPAFVRHYSKPSRKHEETMCDEALVTTVQPSKIRNPPSSPPTRSESTELVDSLLDYTYSLVDPSALNIIAFSGGVDSSLAAALVYQTIHGTDDHDRRGNVLAVLGVSPSLPENQLILARSIAYNIGIDLKEVPTTEGFDVTYVENQGQACFVCKSHLYSALEAVTTTVSSIASSHEHQNNVIMYNGTNADDTKDPTRLGLVAAKAFSVQSPLIHTTKDDIRRAAKHMN